MLTSLADLRARYAAGKELDQVDIADLIDTIAGAARTINPGTVPWQIGHTNVADTGSEWADPCFVGYWVAQTAHGFLPGQVLYCNSSGVYLLATTADPIASNALGIVLATTTNSFFLTTGGKVTLPDLTTALDSGSLAGQLALGSTYYLSSTTPGRLSLTPPNTNGAYSCPVLLAIGGNTGILILQGSTVVSDIPTPTPTPTPVASIHYRPFLNANVLAVANGSASPSTTASRLYLGGQFTTLDTQSQIRLAAYNADAGADVPSFNQGLGFYDTVASQPFVRDIAVLNPGGSQETIVVAGKFDRYAGSVAKRCALLNADGTLRAGMDFYNAADTGHVGYGATICPNYAGTKFWVGGTVFYSAAGSGNYDIALANLDGSLDATFHNSTLKRVSYDGVTPTVVARIVLAAPGVSDDIYAMGLFSSYTLGSTVTATPGHLIRLDSAGNVVAKLGQTVAIPSSTLPRITDMIVASGYVYIVGAFQSVNSIARVGIARLVVNGSTKALALDTGWNLVDPIPTAGFTTINRIVTFVKDNVTYALLAGQFRHGQNQNVTMINLSTGATVATFAVSTNAAARNILVLPDTPASFVVSGEFTTLNASGVAYTARIDQTGAII